MPQPVKKLLVMCAVALFAQGASAAGEPQGLQGLTSAQKQQMQTLIKEAAKEGQLTYWDTVIQPTTNDALVAAFKKYYGLPSSFRVNYSLSKAGGLVTRVDQEIASGRDTIDVADVAALPWVYAKVKAGDVMHYESPQYKYYQSAFKKGLGEDGYFAFNGGYIFVPMWSAGTLKIHGDSWKDIIDAVKKGRMSMGDAGKSPTYLSTYIGLRKVLPKSYFEKLAAMKPTFIVRSEQIANEVVTGQTPLAFSGMPTRAYQFNERGAHLKFMIPKEGVVLLPQATFILKKAPHPAAAKLWIDFVLSDPGQKILVTHEALISGRKGFVSPIPKYAPSIDSLPVIKIDWKKITIADMKKAREQWLNIFNR